MESFDEKKEKRTGFSNMEDPQVGMDWVYPKCITCAFNQKGFCKKFDLPRMEVPVDIYDCPEYVDKEEADRKEAMQLFGIE